MPTSFITLRCFFSIPLCTCVLALMLFSGCEEETLEPTDFSADYAYYPLELNQPKFYALDSIVLFRTLRGVRYDTARLEVRETLVEQFTAADGTETYRGERWDRRLPDGEWRFRQTYTESRSRTTASRSEDNLTFTKLVFPIREGKGWDGHTAFDDGRTFVVGGEFLAIYQGWNYEYEAPDDSIAAADPALGRADVVLVKQAQSDNLIELTEAYELYAPGIGRVSRFIDSRRSQCQVCCNGPENGCNAVPWDDRAEKGFILRETFLR